MNIRMLAEADLAITLEDSATGFGWPVKLTDPAGVEYLNLTAQADDISQIVDPDTGTVVSGRKAAATLRQSTLKARGIGEIKGVADTTRKPWLATFDDIGGTAYTFKVEYADPDRTLGTITLVLGAWT